MRINKIMMGKGWMRENQALLCEIWKSSRAESKEFLRSVAVGFQWRRQNSRKLAFLLLLASMWCVPCPAAYPCNRL